MNPPKTTQVLHPSGRLYEAFRAFSRSHPEACWFQTDAFFRLAMEWPEAEPVLMLAVREEGLRDPGLRGSGFRGSGLRNAGLGGSDTGGTGGQQPPGSPGEKKPASKAKTPQDASADMVAGSLLGVILREPHPAKTLLKAFAGPYRKLTTRTLVYGGPLLAEGTRLQREMTLKVLLRALQDEARSRSLFTQLRNFHDLSDYKPLFRDAGFEWHDHLNQLVDTSSEEALWKGLSESRRRQVQKSLDNGAEVVHDPSPAQVDDLYAILQELYTKKVRKPLPSRAFFHALSGMPGDQAITIVVTHQKKVIGGIVCPVLPGKVMYEWYVCGLDRAYKDRGIHPSVLATWEALEYAAGNGIPEFDFMGMGTPDEAYGVRTFKERFGGRMVNHGRYSTVNRKLLYTVAELGYNLVTLGSRRNG